MSTVDLTAIAAFIERHAHQIAWVLRDAGGLWERADIESEAYVALAELGAAAGQPLDLSVEEHAARLLQSLRRAARKAGLGMRAAVRPDQAGSGEDWIPGTPGWDRLAADEGEHPLTLLEGLEEDPEARPAHSTAPDAYHSPYAGWLWLLERFDRRMADVAPFLLISTSWSYICRNRAEKLVLLQQSLPRSEAVGDVDDALRPWRKFKLPPRGTALPHPQQRSFNFWARPSQPATGQLWLL